MQFSIDRTLELLSATPNVISGLLSGLSDEWIEGGTRVNWGPAEIVGHLIHCDKADWIPRAKIILKHGESEPFEPLDRHAQFLSAASPSLKELLSQFADIRRQKLEELRSLDLSDEHLDLNGTHPEFGRVTLRQLLATWAVHDLTHIRQISTVLATKYAGAVGPWREYLSILR